MDTIFALSTPPGRAGVAVVRISGDRARDVFNHLKIKEIPPRQAAVRRLWDGDEILDDAIVIRFEKSASFTGDESVELQLHGSIAVRDAVLGKLGSLPGFRLAEPGEFTRRALENGRMDIAEVEGLAALIDSETSAQRRQAHRLMDGGLGRMADAWREKLIEALALLEVTIDFADEEVPVDVTPDVIGLLDKVINDLSTQIAGVGAAERVREGFEVAIVGAPNAGKSTLLNALAGRDAAITSDVAGTTRDVIEVRMDLGGLPVTFLDTAGLRATEDTVETLGIERAAERANAADLRVFLKSEHDLPDVVARQAGDVEIWGKGDLRTEHHHSVSGTTGAGIQRLVDDIASELQGRTAAIGTATHARHQAAMQVAEAALKRAKVEVLSDAGTTEIAAQEMRDALTSLDRLVGRVDVEDILDQIFSRFCLGK